jgi:hypothetical protein
MKVRNKTKTALLKRNLWDKQQKTEDIIKESKTEPNFFLDFSIFPAVRRVLERILKYKINLTQHVAKKQTPKLIRELQITGIKKTFVSIAEQ